MFVANESSTICGGGADVHHLTGKGYEVTGVDAHGAFLTVANERGYLGKFIKADLTETLPFDDKSFDTTYCFDVLEHIDDAFAIRELVRVTRQRLIVGVPQKDDRKEKYLTTYYPYLDLTHLRYYTIDTLRDLLTSAGGCAVEVFPTDRVPIQVYCT